jgi:hypothetical protein
MALTNTLSTRLQIAAGTLAGRVYPIEDHGKTRWQWASVVQGAAAGDANSTYELFDFPPGRIRIIPWLSRYKSSALGAARLMSLGFGAYSPGASVADVAQNLTELFSAIDVSAAVVAGFPQVVASPFKLDYFSVGGIRVIAQITGGTIPAAATLDVAIGYIVE